MILQVLSSLSDGLCVPPAARAPGQALTFPGTHRGHQAHTSLGMGEKHLPKQTQQHSVFAEARNSSPNVGKQRDWGSRECSVLRTAGVRHVGVLLSCGHSAPGEGQQSQGTTFPHLGMIPSLPPVLPAALEKKASRGGMARVEPDLPDPNKGKLLQVTPALEKEGTAQVCTTVRFCSTFC